MAQASGLYNRTIRLPFHGILAWIMGSAGRVVMSNMMGAFLLVFYTDVFGLSPAVTGTLFLVARVVDGINDPLMGYVIDRLPQTRWGRYRPAMVLGVVLTALVFIAMFAAPQLSPFGKVAWAYGTYLLFGFVQDLVSIPGRAIVPAITTLPPAGYAALPPASGEGL